MSKEMTVSYWVVVGVFLAGIVLLLTSCSSLQNKAVAIGSTNSALRLEPGGSASSGTFAPNVFVGGGAFSLVTKPKDDNSPVYQRVEQSSWISKIFSLGMDNGVEIYIGTNGETARETEIRLKALRKNQ